MRGTGKKDGKPEETPPADPPVETVKGLDLVEAEEPALSDNAKVGDAVDLPGTSSYVRLPDGSVVTARTTYLFRHVGEHTVINAATAAEQIVHVTAATDDE